MRVRVRVRVRVPVSVRVRAIRGVFDLPAFKRP